MATLPDSAFFIPIASIWTLIMVLALISLALLGLTLAISYRARKKRIEKSDNEDLDSN